MTTTARAVSVFCASVLLASAAAAQSKKSEDNDPDQKELYNYVLTMDKLQKLSNSTKQLQAVAKQHPEINEDGDAKSIDDMVKKFQKYPDAMAVLSKIGLSPREYAVGFMTTIQAAMAVGFKKNGTYKEYPPKMLALVSKANLDFTEQHWDEIQKMAQMGSDDK
jgi:hypothetical protein